MTACFSHALVRIFTEEVEVLRIAHAFQKLVNKTQVPDYYDIVKQPICLDQVNILRQ